MGSISRKNGKLTVTMEITRIMSSPTVSFVDGNPVEGITFKASVANALLKMANEKIPDLKNKVNYEKSTIDLTEDGSAFVVTFE